VVLGVAGDELAVVALVLGRQHLGLMLWLKK
jgi:hypothetical protein